MSQQDENKPIYNLQNYTEKKQEVERNPDDILTWKKSNITSYLRGVFDGRGNVYYSENNEHILSIQHTSIERLEVYQKALQMLSINSFLYYPQLESESSELFIVGKTNVLKFKEKIGYDNHEEADIFYNYWKKLDWED
ncbi:MAG: hypothetical protein FK734_17200 [Asgard group archaeon]|nr:hypothetical protein [Asgard group archaeon]